MRFKVWDSEKKEFVDENRNFYIRDDGFLHFHCKGNISFAPNKYIPVYFTGQTDKNGVEIYEGDIVKRGETLKKGNVVVSSFITQEQCKWGELSLANLVYHQKDLEIIGNKFENPELLEN